MSEKLDFSFNLENTKKGNVDIWIVAIQKEV